MKGLMTMNFSNEEFRYELRRTLLEIRPIRKGTDNWYSIRCPLCGDSKSDKRKTRFYIHMDMSEDMPFIYYCFNCGETGIINPTILKALEMDSIEMVSGIRAMNKRATRNNKKYNFKIEKMELSIPYPDREDPNIIRKKEYLEGRLGREFSFEELHRLKVVFNIGHLLSENNITKLSTTTEKALLLDDNYIGFLSTNNEMLNMRQVISCKLERYEKYVIERDKVNYLKFYSIPVEIDLFTDEEITINLVEGPMDILGLYYHVDDGGKKNSIYSAVCGADYRSVIEYFIKEGFIGNVIMNIYRDQDQDTSVLAKLKEEYKEWFIAFNVYSNTLAKDLGVPREKIELIKNRKL